MKNNKEEMNAKIEAQSKLIEEHIQLIMAMQQRIDDLEQLVQAVPVSTPVDDPIPSELSVFTLVLESISISSLS